MRTSDLETTTTIIYSTAIIYIQTLSTQPVINIQMYTLYKTYSRIFLESEKNYRTHHTLLLSKRINRFKEVLLRYIQKDTKVSTLLVLASCLLRSMEQSF